MKTLTGMKDKKLVHLIYELEKVLEEDTYDMSDFIMQEAATDILTKRGYTIRYIWGKLVCYKNGRMWGGQPLSEGLKDS